MRRMGGNSEDRQRSFCDSFDMIEITLTTMQTRECAVAVEMSRELKR